MTLLERARRVAAAAPAVEVGDTIRLLVTTCYAEGRAPDGGVKFPEGLVVLVDDVDLDGPTARRWVKNRIAEAFPGGTVGDVVTAEERTADPGDLDAQIARLQQLRDRAAAIAEERAVAAASAATAPRRDPSLAIGRDRYRVPGDERPMAVYGLADAQLAALENAGFTRPEIVDAASDEDLLDVKGIGKPTLARLRGRAE